MTACTAPRFCDRCWGFGTISVPNPDGSDNALIRRCPGPCRTCNGQGIVARPDGLASTPEAWSDCPDCGDGSDSAVWVRLTVEPRRPPLKSGSIIMTDDLMDGDDVIVDRGPDH